MALADVRFTRHTFSPNGPRPPKTRHLKVETGAPSPWHVSVWGKDGRGCWRLLTLECLHHLLDPSEPDSALVTPWLAQFGVGWCDTAPDPTEPAIVSPSGCDGDESEEDEDEVTARDEGSGKPETPREVALALVRKLDFHKNDTPLTEYGFGWSS